MFDGHAESGRKVRLSTFCDMSWYEVQKLLKVGFKELSNIVDQKRCYWTDVERNATDVTNYAELKTNR